MSQSLDQILQTVTEASGNRLKNCPVCGRTPETYRDGRNYGTACTNDQCSFEGEAERAEDTVAFELLEVAGTPELSKQRWEMLVALYPRIKQELKG